MDRVTGWYERNAQIWLIIIGLILAAAFDVDSVRLGYILFQRRSCWIATSRPMLQARNNASAPPSFLE